MKVAICDHCKKQESLIKGYGYRLPKGWLDDWKGDLCPKCYKELDKFFNKK